MDGWVGWIDGRVGGWMDGWVVTADTRQGWVGWFGGRGVGRREGMES